MTQSNLRMTMEIPDGWTKETALARICKDHAKINFLCHNSNKYEFSNHVFDMDLDSEMCDVVFYLDDINKAHYVLIYGEYDV